MRVPLTSCLLALGLVLCAGCGQKGSLVLPEGRHSSPVVIHAPPPAPPAAAPAAAAPPAPAPAASRPKDPADEPATPLQP